MLIVFILLLCHTGATDTGDNKGYLTWFNLTWVKLSICITAVITHADDTGGSKAFIRVCVILSVCLSVCPHDKTTERQQWKVTKNEVKDKARTPRI